MFKSPLSRLSFSTATPEDTARCVSTALKNRLTYFFSLVLFSPRCLPSRCVFSTSFFSSVDVFFAQWMWSFCSIDALFLLLSFAPRCLPSTSSYWPSTSLILSWKETIIRLRDSGEICMVFVFNWRQMLKCIFSSWPLVLTRLQLAHLIGALKMALLLMLVISFDPWAYIGHEVTFLVIMRHSFCSFTS